MAMSDGEWMRDRARELRGQGATLAAIGELFGRSPQTIMRWTDPDKQEKGRRSSRHWKGRNADRMREYDRWYYEEHKKPCPHCGTAMGSKTEMCAGCHTAVADVRRTLVEGMWADGWIKAEINAALGLNPGSNMIYVMRVQRGWDLPHRRGLEALANLRANHPKLRDLA